uniref:Uncharacterized protein n=1 Tax=Anguilla anguilla TaxID=7936 RepID=A0A0E9TCH3_ANGAN
MHIISYQRPDSQPFLDDNIALFNIQ